MIEKKFGVDFHSEGGALTLQIDAVTHLGDPPSNVSYTRTHESGWTIEGVVSEDYFYWVNEFEATHSTLGQVKGNFEESVFADTEEGFRHFMQHHSPMAWDYGDI